MEQRPRAQSRAHVLAPAAGRVRPLPHAAAPAGRQSAATTASGCATASARSRAARAPHSASSSTTLRELGGGLVADLADELLEHVLERDDAEHRSPSAAVTRARCARDRCIVASTERSRSVSRTSASGRIQDCGDRPVAVHVLELQHVLDVQVAVEPASSRRPGSGSSRCAPRPARARRASRRTGTVSSPSIGQQHGAGVALLELERADEQRALVRGRAVPRGATRRPGRRPRRA